MTRKCFSFKWYSVNVKRISWKLYMSWRLICNDIYMNVVFFIRLLKYVGFHVNFFDVALLMSYNTRPIYINNENYTIKLHYTTFLKIDSKKWQWIPNNVDSKKMHIYTFHTCTFKLFNFKRNFHFPCLSEKHINLHFHYF